tara:strand:+ start:53 stop:559 length:507 start_codon:yes stop_codon:yes gene_type:complete
MFEDLIECFPDFPKKGIIFRDIMPLLRNPIQFSSLIKKMSSEQIFSDAEAIIAIDSRGFIFGSCIALELKKPLITARKSGKLPGELISKKYDLEYGSNSLSIQTESIKPYSKYVIVDDLLATGGTAKCVVDILNKLNKKVCGISVVIELKELKGRDKFICPVSSQILY